MFPILFHSGDIIIPAFFTMIMMGILFCTFYLYFLAPKRGFSQIVILDCGLIGSTMGLIGARLFHVFVEAWPYYYEDLWRILEISKGGMVSYGAFILGALSLILYFKYRKVNVLEYADFIALGVPFLVFFTRLGCLGAGCCYGNPTDFFIHLVFSNPHSAAGHEHLNVPLHATQVYAMLYAALIFGIVNWYYFKKKYHGEVILLFFTLYAIFRSLMEFLRGDEDRGVYFDGAISTAQVVGIFVLLICSALYFWIRKTQKPISKT